MEPSDPGRPALPILGDVPPRNLNFTGREELLARLDSQVRSNPVTAVLPTARPPYAMYGLGGVGKTQIVTEYIYRHAREYDIIWWITADTEFLIESKLAQLAQRMGLPPAASPDQDAAAALVALRQGVRTDRWLLVFDNATEPAALQRFLPSGPGHTLITSLNPGWNDLAEPILVDVFSVAESVDLLKRYLPRISTREAEELAETLGNLPLALEQAAALLRHSGMSIGEYRTYFAERASELLPHGTAGYPQGLVAAMAVLFTQVRKNLPDSDTLLKCCAFLGPQPIPRDVLSYGRRVVSSPLREILGDPVRFSKAIIGLDRYSLIQLDEKDRRLQVHRVVQALIREELSAQEQDRIRDDAQQLLAAATPRDPDEEPGSSQHFAELMPHYAAADLVASGRPEVRLSVRGLIRYHYLNGNFRQAQELAERARAQWSEDPRTSPADLLAVQRHLGATLRARARYRQAYDVNATALAEATRVLGANDGETLRVLNSHGADLRAAGRFAEARQLDEDSVRRCLDAFGQQGRQTLWAQNNLALDYTLLGQFEQARDLEQQVYEIGLDVYRSPAHVSVLASREFLGRILRLLGEYTEARPFAADAYEACRASLGSGHPVTLRAARDLVIATRLTGDYQSLVPFGEQVLAEHEQAHGRQHPATLMTATALVNVWLETGHLDQAMAVAQEAQVAFPRVFGHDHPFTHGCLINLATVRRHGGDAASAQQLHSAAAGRLGELLGPDHYYALMAQLGWASDLAALGQHERAAQLGEQLTQRLRAALPADHPTALAAASNLSADLEAAGQASAAAQLRSATVERFDQVLGEEHPAVQAAREGQRIDVAFDPSPI
ncbi:MAG TPA: FxSxx-COOH system tetratricopeptide repeat protein [Streptosporangiaceae bacterium]|jgi:tetratricopeptide (TPR) repeat protein